MLPYLVSTPTPGQVRGWGGVRASTQGLRLDETVVTGEQEVNFRKVGFFANQQLAVPLVKASSTYMGRRWEGGTRASLFSCLGQEKMQGTSGQKEA